MLAEKVYSAPADSIVVDEERIRKEFKLQDLNDLAESLKKAGQIQPGVCIRLSDGRYKLVAGERRLKACKMAGLDFVFMLREDLKEDDLMIRIIELEENIVRADLTWQEKANALASLHEAYQGKGWNRHSIEDTAKKIGKSKGFVSEEIELAYWAQELPEIAEAKKKTEAKKIIKRYKEELERQLALEEALLKEEEKWASREGALEPGAEPKPLDEKEKFERILEEFDRRILLGDMLEQIEHFDDGYFDIVLFDPPWGVDFDAVRYSNGSTKSYADESEGFEQKLEQWLKVIERKMAQDSFLFMFFAIRQHGMIYELLSKLKFETNGIPYIWRKRGAHHTRNPDIWPGRCYEPIVYARKGAKSLQLKGAPDIITTPMPTPKIKADHPSAKHPQIYRELLERAAKPGDKVLDPMCGSGMAGVACESMRASHMLDWHMIELDKTFRDLALFNVYKGYDKIVGDYGKPPMERGSYKNYLPGTPKWKEYWEMYPEDQEEMLAWKKELGQKGIK